jgi:glycosyltransferase involved in cell wall biosynthesis
MRGPRVCLVPRLSGVGGMVSFQARLAAGLAQRGIQVCYGLDDRPYQAVLVIGGTRHLAGLWRARREGLPVVQRLDGMNWVHRLKRTGLRHALRAEYGNWLLALIRSRLATCIIYQSRFSQDWWERVYGPTPVPSRVVYNGVDLGLFNPAGEHERPADCARLLLVEGSLMGGYEMGLEVAVGFTEALDRRIRQGPPAAALNRAELMVVGRVAEGLRQRWQSRSRVPIRWAGLLPGERIPYVDRSAHLLYSADVNAACPNSVIEALACGLPVIAFATGALPELVPEAAGRVVPYGGDPWKLEPPDVPALAEAAEELLRGGERFRRAARSRAEAAFGLNEMVNQYVDVLLGA